MKKILIIQTAFIGDVILATSLIEKLHQHFPEAQLDFLLRKGNENLLHHHPHLHHVLIWDKKENKTKNLFSILKKIRNSKYDAVINCQRFFSTGFLTAFSNAKQKIGFDKNPLAFFFSKKIKHEIAEGKNFIHEIQRNHSLIQHLTDLTPAAPTSVWFTKQLPAKKWLELIDKLPKNNDIFLLGAPNDLESCDKIKSAANHSKIHNLAGKLNRFGFTPVSSVRRVLETKEKLDCRPCGLHGFKACPKGHFKCSEIKF